jgi:hypothetical protein
VCVRERERARERESEREGEKKREKERERFVCTSFLRDEAQACAHMYVEIGMCAYVRVRLPAYPACTA